MLTGGIESHLQEFCNNMSSGDNMIDLVILNSRMSSESKSQFENHCRHIYLGKSGRSIFRLFWLIGIGLLVSMNRYACLYTNGQGNSPFIFSKLLFRKRKWVHHHHMSGDVDDQKQWTKLYKKALTHADVVIACSSRNANLMSQVLGRDISSIPCFSRQINKIAERQSGKIRLGYYGRLIPEKGIDILIRLSDDPTFNDIEFHIWGEGDAYPKSYFDEHKHLVYHGSFQSVSVLTEIITLLDGFLLISSHSEGLPVCLLECMSAGLPWLATDRGGISDVVLDINATRLISDKSTYSEIIKAVKDFYSAIVENRISKEGQIKFYNTFFGKDALTKKWENVLLGR